jgi:hypothetical protein
MSCSLSSQFEPFRLEIFEPPRLTAPADGNGIATYMSVAEGRKVNSRKVLAGPSFLLCKGLSLIHMNSSGGEMTLWPVAIATASRRRRWLGLRLLFAAGGHQRLQRRHCVVGGG